MTRILCMIFIAYTAWLSVNGQTSSFDDNWLFLRGGAQGAEKPGFDDSRWRNLDLPHDWSIENLPGTQSPFDPLAISQVSGGFTTGGNGWYRKKFTVSDDAKGKRIQIQFDGVYQNAHFWVNGVSLGEHPYGYTSFRFDITDRLDYDKENIIAVQVRNEGVNSRWYTGSGIYRHVWLKILEPVYIDDWGLYITTPEVNTSEARVNIKSVIINKSSSPTMVRLVTHILDAQGEERGTTESALSADADSQVVFDQNAIIKNPELWSVETPTLYTAVSKIYIYGEPQGSIETQFGIRTISYDTNGFRLNGKILKLKGGCVHHDNGPLGAKAYDRAEERRVELLKASGFNAIRCSHNPPSPAFLKACDKLGMLVIDEAFDMWRIANNPYDYHLWFDDWWQKDIESMVTRDRNHPSIILWSIGNEIRDMENPEVIEVGKKLADLIRQLDPTRPIMAAVNNLRPQKDPFFGFLDVSGYNYAAGGDHKKESIYAEDHKRVPDRIMLGTESYPLEAFGAWMPVVDYPYVIGDFVWTAFDYIGEASIGWRGYWQESSFYPWNLAYCGDIDICGWKRPQSYYRDALWNENQISLFVTPPKPSFELNPNKQSWSKWEWHDVVPHWNFAGHEGHPLDVSVYSSFGQVELFLNGKSLGKKSTDRSTQFMAIYSVPYEPGELKAVGLNGSHNKAVTTLSTSGEPVAIRMTADRTQLKADGHDLSYITVELTDNNGIINPLAENLVRFSIEGEGSIAGVGNANPLSTESYQMPERKAWQGKCLVIVKTSRHAGNIKVTAEADGMKAEVNLVSE